MDNEFEEDYVFSEDEDYELGNEPWQFGLSSVSERVLALNQNGSFTDITLTFPGTDITYDAHRLILAISSPVFEGILYGPMRTEGRNVLLHDDDPWAMKQVLAHCYGFDLELPDMDITLEVYKLADKYLINSLKKDCCEYIVNHLDPDNNNDVIEFAERYNFKDLKSNCLPLIKDLIEDALDSYDNNECYIDQPDNIDVFELLMSLSDTWIKGFLSKVTVKVLDFHESWKYPESPLEDNRLRTILLSRRCSLKKFYGCINADMMHHIPLGHIPGNNKKKKRKTESMELYLSVTDPHHAKRVIEAINQQNRFEHNLIAIHIRCEEVWPKNWSPIRPERTHRPSLLLISDADDDKASWIVEAAKAYLPQCEGSGTNLFRKDCYGAVIELEPVSILFLLRSYFTPNGFINMLQKLYSSGIKCDEIFLQSPHISYAHKERFEGFIHTLEHKGFNRIYIRLLKDSDNFFRNIFKTIPEKYE